MKPNAPTQPVWVIAIVLGVLGLAVHYGVDIKPLRGYTFELVALGWLMLVIGTTFRKL